MSKVQAYIYNTVTTMKTALLSTTKTLPLIVLGLSNLDRTGRAVCKTICIPPSAVSRVKRNSRLCCFTPEYRAVTCSTAELTTGSSRIRLTNHSYSSCFSTICCRYIFSTHCKISLICNCFYCTHTHKMIISKQRKEEKICSS